MKSGPNLFASVSYSAWSAITSLAAVPLLIHYLGVEAYGLVGIYVSAQGILYILDMGLAPAVNREVARNIATHRAADSATLLRTLGPIYWAIAILIGVGFYLLAPLATEHWLNIEKLSAADVNRSLILLGLVIACRWPAALYQNVLMGAGRLTITSTIGIITVTLSNGGGVLVVAFLSASLEAFFLWQLVCMVAYTQMMRLMAWRVIGHRSQAQRDAVVVMKLWRFSAGMAGVSITAVLLMQLDKILLTKLLPLEDFGRYVIASLLASGLYVLLSPTFNIIYPRFSALIAGNAMQQLQQSYRTGTRLLCCVLFPTALGGVLFSEEVILLWTSDALLAEQVAPTLSIMLLGTAFNGAMHFPYALQLASGASWIPLITNILLLLIFVPLVIVLTSQLGLIGGATAWLVVNSLYLLLGSLFTHRILMRGVGFSWLVLDVALPFGLSWGLLAAGNSLIDRSTHSTFEVLAMGAALSILAIALCCIMLLTQQTRQTINRGFQLLARNRSIN